MARIKSYELAARMQVSAPEVTDIRGESEATREMYGLNDPSRAITGTTACWRGGWSRRAFAAFRCTTAGTSARRASIGTATKTCARTTQERAHPR